MLAVRQDHKPDLDDERQRIERCGGMVERLQNHNNKESATILEGGATCVTVITCLTQAFFKGGESCSKVWPSLQDERCIKRMRPH